MLDLRVRMSSQWTTLPSNKTLTAAMGAGGSRLTSNLISKSLGQFRERSLEVLAQIRISFFWQVDHMIH